VGTLLSPVAALALGGVVLVALGAAELSGCGSSFEAGAAVTATGNGSTTTTGGTGQGGTTHAGGTTNAGGATHAGGAGGTTHAGGVGQGGGALTTDAGALDAAAEGGALDAGAKSCSDAGAFVCAPDAPPGWKGPIAYHTGGPNPVPPGCESGWSGAEEVFPGDLVAAPAQCTCSCTAQGGSCETSLTIQASVAAGCGAGTSFDAAVGKCGAVGAANGSVEAWPPAVASAPQCAASATKVVPLVGWTAYGRICSLPPPGGACDASTSCVPAPDATGALCVTQVGDVACPLGPYSKKTLVHTAWSDTRSCSACGCQPPSGIACSATVQLSNDPACNGAHTDLPADGATCKNGSFLYGKPVAGNAGLPAAVCDPSGGEPTGEAKVVESTTVCCMP
jgi:hypothetical protein